MWSYEEKSLLSKKELITLELAKIMIQAKKLDHVGLISLVSDASRAADAIIAQCNE